MEKGNHNGLATQRKPPEGLKIGQGGRDDYDTMIECSGGSRGGSQGAMEPPFQSRLCTDTVARLQLASSN